MPFAFSCHCFQVPSSKFQVPNHPKPSLDSPPLETSWRRVSRRRVKLPNLDRRLTSSSLELPRMDICTAPWTHGFFKKNLLRHISMPSLFSRSRSQTPLQSLFDLLSLYVAHREARYPTPAADLPPPLNGQRPTGFG
jgi:hypothetical protein